MTVPILNNTNNVNKNELPDSCLGFGCCFCSITGAVGTTYVDCEEGAT